MSVEAAASPQQAPVTTRVVLWGALALGLVVLSLSLRAPSFIDVPLDRDEGAYALIAQQWARGATLYRDYFDHKPPLIYGAYRGIFAVAGERLAAVRTAFALANAFTALVCAGIVWRLTAGRQLVAALLTAVAACIFLNSPLVQGETANTETLMVLGTACAAWLISQAARGRIAATLAGVCAGLALLAKPVALCEAAFFAIWLATRASPGPTQARRFIAGVVLPSLVCGLYALGHAALVPSIDAVLFYNLRYAGAAAVPLWARLAALPIDYGVPLALLWAGVAGCTLTVLRSGPQPANFALGWTAAALVGTLASGRIYDHYYQQLIPPMAVGLGITAAAIGQLTRSRGARIAYAIAVAVGLWPPITAARNFAAYGRVHSCADWQPRLAAVIRSLTAPDDRLFIWGAEPYLNFAAERRPPNRFIYKYPLLSNNQAGRDAWLELLSTWNARPPAVIVVVKSEASAEPGNSAATEILASDAPFHRLLNGFAPALETEGFVLYARTDLLPLPWQVHWERSRPDGCTSPAS